MVDEPKKVKEKKVKVSHTENVPEIVDVGKELDVLEKSVPQMFNEAQRNLILNETPRYKIKKRKGKGGLMFDYVDISYVIEQLNILTGHRWDFKVLWQTPIEEAKAVGQFIVRGELTIYGQNGVVVQKQNYGKADLKEKTSGGFLDFGNDMKGAESDCIKKCASMFGIALDVYSGSVTRRQDLSNPDGQITESQRRRLEVIAQDSGIGHSGLKKIINELYDYTSTEQIQRRHFAEISEKIEGKQSESQIEVVIPEDIVKGFDALGTPEAKRKALFLSYNKKEGGIDELRKKINAKVDENNSRPKV